MDGGCSDGNTMPSVLQYVHMLVRENFSPNDIEKIWSDADIRMKLRKPQASKRFGVSVLVYATRSPLSAVIACRRYDVTAIRCAGV
jgi:hypothetical protein